MRVSGISVIIPNYNGRLLLEQIIPPLMEALIHVGIPYEIIVVDDTSSDDSVKYLRQFFKEITVLQNETNTGFPATINKGIFFAKLSHLLLLNNDVKLTKNYFESQIKYFERPDTFGVMGRIIGWDNDIIQDGGKYPCFQGAKIKTSGNYIPVEPLRDSWLYSIYLSGANAFVERVKILQLKGFDEIFSPYYIEDFELSLRAWRLGWKCYYEHSAVCRHRTSSTIKSYKKKNEVAVIYNRNKMYLHAIHLKGGIKFLWYVQLTGELIFRAISLRFYFLKSFYLFLLTRKKVVVSRKAFSAIAKTVHRNLSIRKVAKEIKVVLANESVQRI